jgi:hypothetical protein
MKRNGMLLVVYSMLALMVTAGVMQGDMLSWNGLMCWVLSFSFWFLMLLPAWEFPKKQDPYQQYDPEWEREVRDGR